MLSQVSLICVYSVTGPHLQPVIMRGCLAFGTSVFLILVLLDKLVTVPLHIGARLLTCDNPQLCTRNKRGFREVEGRAESIPADQFWRITDWALVSNVWRRHVVNHLVPLFDPLEWERESRRGSKDSLYSHLLINGGHHRHLTRLIDPRSLQGLCCVSICYWLFQVYSSWPLSLPTNRSSPRVCSIRDFFKQSFEIIICVSKCHNRPWGLVLIGQRAEVSEVSDWSIPIHLCDGKHWSV